VISWSPTELLMFIQALSLLDTQRSYRARKSAVSDAVVTAVVAGSNGLKVVLLKKISAQEGELDMVAE
jgi:hypothetical protein